VRVDILNLEVLLSVGISDFSQNFRFGDESLERKAE
jgi:hypothetical protein